GGYFFQARSIFALVPIFMADRLPGKVRLKRYTAYWFYPVHIAVLVITVFILSKKSFFIYLPKWQQFCYVLF
ncbi:MAG: hypothetical protein GX114_02225, partial [Clostridiales bacterium]|nr:hypothetical protein [Clostridiales bacterium]